MLKKLRIALLFLSMSVILLHGAIPHHHHKAFSEPDCSHQVLHPETQHHCDFTSHDHGSSGELVCHFYLVASKLSIAKYFVSPPSFLPPVFCLEVHKPVFGYKAPKPDLVSFLPFSPRAPPAAF